MEMFEYSAKVVKVVDGDTIDFEVDLGFGIKKVDRFRLSGINTPEMRGPEKEAGRAAKMFVIGMLEGARITIFTKKDKQGKYGRYLADVWIVSLAESLNDLLVETGHAVEVNYD
jgi:micrococcal nuclease